MYSLCRYIFPRSLSLRKLLVLYGHHCERLIIEAMMIPFIPPKILTSGLLDLKWDKSNSAGLLGVANPTPAL